MCIKFIAISKYFIVEKPTSNLKSEILSQENLNKRPPLMDFLDIRGSISGYKSFRDTEKGIFTSHFCYFLNFLLKRTVTYATLLFIIRILSDLPKLSSHCFYGVIRRFYVFTPFYF